MAVTSPKEETEVLIVGSGPVGLASAIELGHRGIRCTVVEQQERVGQNPRAKTTNVRTREHLRRWGIADALRKASTLPAEYPSNIVFATSMKGPVLARIENAFYCWPERNDLYSESGQWVPQYLIEEVMRGHLAGFSNVSFHFNQRLSAVEQCEHAVKATLVQTETGEESTIASKYLIGADGGRSTVRKLIGATMTGRPAEYRNFNVVLRAPKLAAMHPLGPAIQYWLVNNEAPCLFGPMDGVDRWYFMATKIDKSLDPESVDVCDMIRRSTGIDFEMEIVGSVDPWLAHSLIADRYSDRRLFLAGDACHLHVPFGGFGMNMGIADGVDLGWKMAATLQGWGGPHLLATYEQERRPVHLRVLNEANLNYVKVANQFIKPGLDAPGPEGDAVREEVGAEIVEEKTREFKALGVVLGYRYENSPAIIPDGTEPPEEHFKNYVPSAHPGCVAPHLWLRDGSSLYDHFGQGFTLLVTNGKARESAEPVVSAAHRLGVPLFVLAPEDDRLPHLYQASFALIRPDQHVSWRGDWIPTCAEDLLNTVRGAWVDGQAPRRPL
jgi:2-polyprenyl-6-methoxyphenol hydroxylase-like FAD-dependent oxidoreductase